MRKIYLFAQLLLCTICIAQTPAKSGYFIDNSGRRTECQLLPLYNQTLTGDISYLLGDSQETKKISASQLQEFGYDQGEVFKKFTVEIDESSESIQDLGNTGKPVFKTVSVFMEYLVSGDYELYRYDMNGLSKFFSLNAKKGETIPQQLIHIKDEKDDKIAVNNRFMYQLFRFFEEPADAYPSYLKLKYREKDLTRLFLSKNGAQGKRVAQNSKKNKFAHFRYAAFAGVNSHKVEVTHSNPRYAAFFVPSVADTVYVSRSASATESRTTFLVGAEVEAFLFPSLRRFSFAVAPYYSSLKAEQKAVPYNYSMPSMTFDPTFLDVNVDLSYIMIPIELRFYPILQDKKELYLGVNMGGSVFLKKDFVVKSSDGEAENVKLSNKTVSGISAGYTWNDIFLRANYFLAGSLSSEISSDSWTLSLGYRF